MPRMAGKHAVMEMLKSEGVEYIFGNPATTETPLMDALESHPEIKYMLTVQEGVAMGMADAYGRASGSPSFVNLHIETGLANGISLLHNAYEGGSPIVLTACNKDVRELAHGRSDLAELTRQFTCEKAIAMKSSSMKCFLISYMKTTLGLCVSMTHTVYI